MTNKTQVTAGLSSRLYESGSHVKGNHLSAIVSARPRFTAKSRAGCAQPAFGRLSVYEARSWVATTRMCTISSCKHKSRQLTATTFSGGLKMHPNWLLIGTIAGEAALWVALVARFA